MPTAIKPKRSTTVGQIPGLSDLQDGEMAINIVDQKIYIRSGNNIETVASAATGAVPVWTLLNTSGQMTVNKRYVIDTSSAELTFAMPTVGLSIGDSIEIHDAANTWAINNVIITDAVNKFRDHIGNLEDPPLILDVASITVMLLWNGSYWNIIS